VYWASWGVWQTDPELVSFLVRLRTYQHPLVQAQVPINHVDFPRIQPQISYSFYNSFILRQS
jgi:hypothetical protein